MVSSASWQMAPAAEVCTPAFKAPGSFRPAHPSQDLELGLDVSVCRRGWAWGCVAQAVTEHHVVVLFPHRLVAVNVVSGRVVQRLPLTGRHAIGVPLGLASDAATGTVYLFTGAAAVSCGLSQPPDVQRDCGLPAGLTAALSAAFSRLQPVAAVTLCNLGRNGALYTQNL